MERKHTQEQRDYIYKAVFKALTNKLFAFVLIMVFCDAA